MFLKKVNDAIFDTIIVVVDENKKISTNLKWVEESVEKLWDLNVFKGKKSEVSLDIVDCKEKKVKIIFSGIGKNYDQYAVADAYAKAVKESKKIKSEDVFVTILDDENVQKQSIVQSCMIANYYFDVYKSEKTEKNVNFIFNLDEISKKEYENGMICGDITNITRDLVNEPANVLTPREFIKRAKKLLKGLDIEVTVLEKEDIEQLQMKSFLSVAQGSENEPYCLVLKYNKGNCKEKLALVGKGITFDSGGFSLKPTGSMCIMKNDMAGAGATLAAFIGIAKSGIKANVVGVMPLCENILSIKAYKPGDVIGSMIGKTIEIDNSDAEGRLILADAVTYSARDLSADKIITIATLTGAVIAALGGDYTGVVSKHKDMYKGIVKAGKVTLNKSWLLPHDDIFIKQLDSTIADIKNSGGRYGGVMSGGMFIEQFADGKDFMHLDIGGAAWSEKGSTLYREGGTGAGAALLFKYVMEYFDN
ncbi:MAG: leucyl aminopeptidase family protein [Oscillospiraceae bacterium]